MSSSAIRRVGRPANPAERGYQLAIENDAVMERCTVNLMAARLDLTPIAAWQRWADLDDDGREMWFARSHDVFRRHIAAWEATVGHQPDDPGPGEPVVTPAAAPEDREPDRARRIA